MTYTISPAPRGRPGFRLGVAAPMPPVVPVMPPFPQRPESTSLPLFRAFDHVFGGTNKRVVALLRDLGDEGWCQTLGPPRPESIRVLHRVMRRHYLPAEAAKAGKILGAVQACGWHIGRRTGASHVAR